MWRQCPHRKPSRACRSYDAFLRLPFGIVSIVYSVQVNSALNARNYELAKINSQKAKYWGSLALWLGLALNLIWFVFGIGGALL